MPVSGFWSFRLFEAARYFLLPSNSHFDAKEQNFEFNKDVNGQPNRLAFGTLVTMIIMITMIFMIFVFEVPFMRFHQGILKSESDTALYYSLNLFKLKQNTE